jgi:hypothetical protein
VADVTIRLIAQRGVFQGKATASLRRLVTVRGFFGWRHADKTSRATLGAPIAASSELYLEDETAYAKVLLPPPLGERKYHLFCSVFNAGALELTEELRESNVFVTKGKRASAPLSFTTDVHKLSNCDHSSKAVQNSPQTAAYRLNHVCCFSSGQCSFYSTSARGLVGPTRPSSWNTSTWRCESEYASAARTSSPQSLARLATHATLR